MSRLQEPASDSNYVSMPGRILLQIRTDISKEVKIVKDLEKLSEEVEEGLAFLRLLQDHDLETIKAIRQSVEQIEGSLTKKVAFINRVSI